MWELKPEYRHYKEQALTAASTDAWLYPDLDQHVNLLKTKRRPLYLKTQSVPRCKHFSSRL
jgi:hypothetical protein